MKGGQSRQGFTGGGKVPDFILRKMGSLRMALSR